jgi:hypothetical protein
MLWTITIILLVLWVLGFITANTFGGFIHVLLIIALILVILNLIQGKKIL